MAAGISAANLDLVNNPGFILALESIGGVAKLGRAPVASLTSGLVVSATTGPTTTNKAQLDALLNYPENTGGQVVNDTNAANNGIYRKVGASGTGSWTRIADLYAAEAAARLLLARDLGAIPLTGYSHTNFNTITASIVSSAATTGLTGTGATSKFVFTPTAGNTGPCTLSISGGPAYPLTRGDGTPLRAGDLKGGETVMVQRRADNTYRIITTTFKNRTLEGGLKQTGAAVAQSHGNQISWDTGRPAFSFVGAGWYAAQPVNGRDELIRCVNTGGTVDLTWLSIGRAVRLYAITQTFVYAGDNPNGDTTGPSFLGQAANINRASLPSGSYAVVRCVQTNPTRLVFETLPAGVTYSAFARPAMNVNVLLAGQSHMVIGGTSGAIGGFARELMSNEAGATTGGAVDRRNFYYTNGATGGTAAVKASVEPGADNYWWDETASPQVPGPMLVNCVAKINAAVALGQPWPTVMLWAQGDGDGLDIQFGTTKPSQFKANTRAIWNYLRNYEPPGQPGFKPMAGMKVIVFPPGSVDNYFTTTGMLAERVAFLELTQEAGTSAWASYGGEMYDLPRNLGQEHLTDDGCYSFGQRWALAFQRVMNGKTIDRGPILESAIYYTGRNVLEVKVRGDSANGTSSWPMPFPGPTDDDRNPFGFQFMKGAVDDDTIMQNTPIGVLDARCIDNSANAFRRFTFEFILDTVPTADVFCYSVGDWAQHHWRKSFPMSLVQHAPAVAVPINFQRTAIQIAA